MCWCGCVGLVVRLCVLYIVVYVLYVLLIRMWYLILMVLTVVISSVSCDGDGVCVNNHIQH